MGLNVNLEMMVNAPSKCVCPHCGATIPTFADDYDIECGLPNKTPGLWQLSVYCDKCEGEMVLEAKIDPVWTAVPRRR